MINRKLALITGGTSGIGFGIAKALLPDHDLALAFKSNQAKADAAQKLLLESGAASQVRCYPGDLSGFPAAQALVANVERDFSASPSVFVHCAGALGGDSLLVKTDFSEILSLVNTHLLMNIALAKLLLPGMYKQKFGRIINLSSITAHFAVRGRRCEYGAAKAGVEGFTRTLALEVAHRGITVNAISPGFIETNMTEFMMAELERRGTPIVRKIPVGFLGQPEDV
ncbi:MAG: SDR family NAD(P)-dependent oxidoreductase, partial [Bdellovibrionota bacterium]